MGTSSHDGFEASRTGTEDARGGNRKKWRQRLSSVCEERWRDQGAARVRSRNRNLAGSQVGDQGEPEMAGKEGSGGFSQVCRRRAGERMRMRRSKKRKGKLKVDGLSRESGRGMAAMLRIRKGAAESEEKRGAIFKLR